MCETNKRGTYGRARRYDKPHRIAGYACLYHYWLPLKSYQSVKPHHRPSPTKTSSSLRTLINPSHIPKLPCKRILKHLLHTIIRCIPLLIQHLRHVRRHPTRQIPARPKTPILRHKRIVVRPRIRRAPRNVPARPDAIIEIRIREDRAVLRVPRAPERALPDDRERGVCLLDDAVVDVDAVRVGEGRVGALPRGDAAAAGAQGEAGRLDPRRAEAVEEVGLAGDDGGVDVGVAELADVDLSGLAGVGEGVGGGGRRWTHGVLVAVEAAEVEAGVGVADADGERGAGRVGRVVVDEVDVVGAEVGVAEGRVGGDGVAGRAAAC